MTCCKLIVVSYVVGVEAAAAAVVVEGAEANAERGGPLELIDTAHVGVADAAEDEIEGGVVAAVVTENGGAVRIVE